MTTLSRRRFVSGVGAGAAALLAGFRLDGPRVAHAGPAQAASRDLALYRPATASSTDYAATFPEFAVDGVASAGVRGSGWRAAPGADPQWIAVDLQARCRIESITLTFEATKDDPPFIPSNDGDPWRNTTGWEVLSSAPTAFRLEVSNDGTAWRTVHETTSTAGGVVPIALPSPVTARWVRLVVTHRLHENNPVGLNGFQVYGTCDRDRPPAKGWTAWGTHRMEASALTVAPDGSVPLESGWVLTLDDWAGSSDGAALSGPNVDTSGWLPAMVPGTVLAALVEEGHLPDPVSGMNNFHVPEMLSRHAWWYRRAFTLPRDLDTRPGRRIWLELDGINHKGEVWLNGAAIGTLLHPFARASFDITSALRSSRELQALAVRISPMPTPGNPGDKGPDGNAFVNSARLYLDSPTYLSASGWDWMPSVRDRAAGIWNHVRLRSTGDAVLGDPRVKSVLPYLPDTSAAELTLTVPVRNAGTSSASVMVRAEFDGISVSKSVSVDAGASVNVVFSPADHPELRLEDPELWWPNGYGDPALHDLTITAFIGGEPSDRRTTRFGIRQFDYSYDLPIVIDPGTSSSRQVVEFSKQTARHVRIQCGRRATGWGNSLWTLSVIDGASPDVDLALHGTATASSVDNPWNPPANAVDGDSRTRWSSAYEDNQWIQVDMGRTVSFDRVVLLWETAYAATFTVQVSADGTTWTDVKSVSNAPVPLRISVNGVPVFCRGGNWGWDELLRRMVPDRMNAVMRMHKDMNFTMIRNWIGSSTREEFYARCDENGILVWNDFWQAGPFLDDPPGYGAIARDTILRYRIHPCIVVWCAANETDPPAVVDAAIRKAIAEEDDEILYLGNSAAGFVSGHGPYYWVDPARYFDPNTYDTGNFGFHTEIGIPTVPVAESMRNLAGDAPAWPIGAVWYHHDWSTKGNQGPQHYLSAIDERLGASESLDEFCLKAQFINYENMRAMFEAWNAHLWQDANALLLWMSHPAWHSTVWQTYDYDLDVNGSYYGARKGCEPLHIQADLSKWQVLAVNHTRVAVEGATAIAELYDLAGRALPGAQSQTVNIGASATAPAFTVPFTDSLPPLHLLRLTLMDAEGNVLAENTYWRHRTAADMRALNDLPRTKLTVRTSAVRATGTRRELLATVRNQGKSVAAMVRLSLRDRRTGARILPTEYSDNYLWLLPDETRTISLSWDEKASTAVRVLAEAYNAHD
ncbi:discoidin domain-containing protein [Pendulispora rubella]|uniref:Discoidin domain-containing protein n=1 Tax=Pendulispora rubella TaxID=2741070 RepID=A0ABZ2L560_9BACT